MSEPSYALEQNQIKATAYADDNHLLKQGIWCYFWLLILEGAFRKWFLPGLSTPLLVIRDPLALWIIYDAWKKKLIPSTIYLWGMVLIGVIASYATMLAGHGNLAVTLFGARIQLLHYPLIFVIGSVFNREDVIKIGVVTLWISIPMVFLIAWQFHSPQGAWVNRGLAGDLGGAGFTGSGGYFRPPGTFSFTTGVSLFFGWLAPFVVYFWLEPNKVNKLLLVAATGALLASMPFSISRALVFEVVLTGVFAIVATLRKPGNAGKVLVFIIAGAAVFVALSQAGFFKIAIKTLVDRFTTADDAEGGLKGVIVDRFLGGAITAITDSSKQPLWGAGMGAGTNVGSNLLTGVTSFTLSEGEWGREIGEMGPILGLLTIFLRTALAIRIGISCYWKMVSGDLLPWLLLSFGFLVIAQGGWSQPSALGFCTMIGGVTLASLKKAEVEG
jgi:hypothetical protein